MAPYKRKNDGIHNGANDSVAVGSTEQHIPLETWEKPTGWMQQIQAIPESQIPEAQSPLIYEGYGPHQGSEHYGARGVGMHWPAQQITLPGVTTYPTEAHNHSSNAKSGSIYPDFSPMQSAGALQSINDSICGNTYNPATIEVNTSHLPQGKLLLSSNIVPESAEGNLWHTRNSAQVFDMNTDFNTQVSDATVPAEAEAGITYGSTGRRKRGRPSLSSKGIDNANRQEYAPRKRGRQKGVKLGTREVLDPGEEFNQLHAQATEAFLGKGDHETALQCILQAISINPEIYSAHVLLSEIYFHRGENDKAIAALFSGAHAAPNDPVVWQQLADACLQKSSGDRTTMLKQATYCYSRILGIDQADSDARFQKAAISRELGYYGKALKDLDVLLKEMPYNSSVMRSIAEVCMDLGDITKARNVYEDALLERQSNISTSGDIFSWSDLLVYVDLISHGEDIVAAMKSLRDISRLLVGRGEEHFWSNYIEDDREWDAEHEPRRIQTPGFQSGRFPLDSYGTSLPLELRVKLGELRLTEGKKQEALKHFEWLDPDARGDNANVFEYPDLFLQTADSLRSAKDFSHAMRYYDALRTVNAYDDIDFWLGIAACAYVCGSKDDALGFYQKAEALDPENIDAHTQLSKLFADRGERSKAIWHAREALTAYENAAGQTEKRRYERREMREVREAAQAAYKRAYMLSPPPGEKRHAVIAPSFSRRAREKKIRADREGREAAGANNETEITLQDRSEKSSRFPRKRLTKAQRTKEQQEENIHQIYVRLCDHTASMRSGDEEARSIWIECAELLVDEFRSKRNFYPAERYKTFQGYDLRLSSRKAKSSIYAQMVDLEATDEADVPLPSIENVIPDDYCGIVFSDWLEVFLEYALLLANLQYEPSECYTVITAATDCCVWYHDSKALTQIYTCYLVCALTLHDEATLFSTALRWFMREYAFCSDVYRLFSALNYYYPHKTDGAGKLGQMHNANFRAQHNQKFVFRHVASLDCQLPEDYGVDTHYGPVPHFMRRERPEIAYLKLRDDDNDDPVANEAQTSHHSPSRRPSVSSTAHTPAADQVSHHEFSSTRSIKPQEMNVHLFIVYGQILYAGGSFPNALSYFYRALSLSPSNSVLLLTMAMCYLHQMLKRQCDNRHAYFLQGLSLFEKYAETRMEWAKERIRSKTDNNGNGFQEEDLDGLVEIVKQEIEFNRARCWHMVGMTDLAMRGYERIIDKSGVKREKGDDDNGEEKEAMDVDESNDNDKKQQDFSMEAAYALMVTYATNGDVDTAKAIAEKWLVVE